MAICSVQAMKSQNGKELYAKKTILLDWYITKRIIRE